MTYSDLLEARLDGILFLQRDVKLVEQDLPGVFQPAKLQKVSIVIIFICGLFSLLFRLIDFTAGGSSCHSWHLMLTGCSAHHLDRIMIFLDHLSLADLDIFNVGLISTMTSTDWRYLKLIYKND